MELTYLDDGKKLPSKKYKRIIFFGQKVKSPILQNKINFDTNTNPYRKNYSYNPIKTLLQDLLDVNLYPTLIKYEDTDGDTHYAEVDRISEEFDK